MQTEASPALQKLIVDDAVGQLRRRDGLMATLGSENGAAKLDWVEGVARLLADATKLEEVETEARAIWERGIRHVIWAGMGGSILAVRVLSDLGFCSGHNGKHMAIYPLDSTDPATLNGIVRNIAEAKRLPLLNGEEQPDSTFLRALLNDVMMIGVSMGMTSEEPITHLNWFTELLQQAELQLAAHLLIMTLPGSYLDSFASEHQVPGRPLQIDGGTGTGGRMSAPTTRVFLLPAALYLIGLSDDPGQLRLLLQRAWQEYNLDVASERPTEHTFVRLAAALSDASTDGTCRLLVRTPVKWHPLVQWIEQLMEESLGKEGKGVVVFDEQLLNLQAPGYYSTGTLYVHMTTNPAESQEANSFNLYQPCLAAEEPLHRLAAVAASFLSWQLCMALYGYLRRITFAGQPAVENYKARARTLRTQNDPLKITLNWSAATTGLANFQTFPHQQGSSYTLLAPQEVKTQGTPAFIFVSKLQEAVAAQDERLRLGYLDFTFNGQLSERLLSVLNAHVHVIGNRILGVPVKLRQAPAAYHSTEQSEMDGPPYLVSLRMLGRKHETSMPGTYTDTFLRAQAVSTWQAMLEQGRPCFLLVFNGAPDEAVEPLHQFFAEVEKYLRDAA